MRVCVCVCVCVCAHVFRDIFFLTELLGLLSLVNEKKKEKEKKYFVVVAVCLILKL